MFNNFLWFLNAKYQHDQQRGTGLSGFVGIVLVIFVLWKWNTIFYPLLEKIGVIKFAKRIGLTHENPLLTIVMVFVFIMILLILFLLIMGSMTLIVPLLLVLVFPFVMIFSLITSNYSKPKNKKDNNQSKGSHIRNE